MKIGFAVGKLDFHSGIVRVVYNIAAELQKNLNYQVAIISTGSVCAQFDMRVFSAGLQYINLDIEKRGHRRKYLYYAGAIYQKIVSEDFDILVVSGTEHVLFYSLGISKISRNTPRMFVWEHRNFDAGPRYRLEWLGKRYALKRWDGVICITKKDAHQYLEHAKEDLIHQIYNLTCFNRQRTEYDIQSRKIISCGSLAYVKGFDMLISVAVEVFKRHPDWLWDIYGEGVERKKLQEMIKEKKLEKNVFLKGYANNIDALYSEYSFFVLTSRAEGMGMVLVEAQKSGLPLISFDIKCGPSDVIVDGVNGFLIEPYNMTKMAERICTLIGNVELREKFSQKSEVKLNEFDKDYIVGKWKTMLNTSMREKQHEIFNNNTML